MSELGTAQHGDGRLELPPTSITHPPTQANSPNAPRETGMQRKKKGSGSFSVFVLLSDGREGRRERGLIDV